MSDFSTSLFEMAGGAAKIRALVTAFYPRVAQNAELSLLFPDDFTEIMEKQYLFLTQFLGGPPLYSERYGSPMLRARHLPHPITPAHAKAWLDCMDEAMEEVDIREPIRSIMKERFTRAAYHMVNLEDNGESHVKPGTAYSQKQEGLLKLD
jgi:hemoglobin